MSFKQGNPGCGCCCKPTIQLHAQYTLQCAWLDARRTIEYYCDPYRDIDNCYIFNSPEIYVRNEFPPVVGAAVTVVDWTGNTVFNSNTDSSGDATITLPGPGWYTVTIHKEPFADYVQTVWMGLTTDYLGNQVCEQAEWTVPLEPPPNTVYVENNDGAFTIPLPTTVNLTDPGGTYTLNYTAAGQYYQYEITYDACINGAATTQEYLIGVPNLHYESVTSPSYIYKYRLFIFAGGTCVLLVGRLPKPSETFSYASSGPGDVIFVFSCSEFSFVPSAPGPNPDDACDNQLALYDGNCDCAGNANNSNLNPFPPFGGLPPSSHNAFGMISQSITGPTLTIDFDQARSNLIGGTGPFGFTLPTSCTMTATLNRVYDPLTFTDGQCFPVTVTAAS